MVEIFHGAMRVLSDPKIKRFLGVKLDRSLFRLADEFGSPGQNVRAGSVFDEKCFLDLDRRLCVNALVYPCQTSDIVFDERST